MNRRRWAGMGVMLLGLALAACGGSGGGSAPTPTPTAAPTPTPTAAPTPTPTPTPAASTFSLSGTIRIARGTRIDGDVNDPFAPFAANDTAEQSQIVPNSGRIGGYLNEAGAGEAGRSSGDGDGIDAYRMSLLAGQAVNMYIGDIAGGDNDLDLFLFDDPDSEPVAASISSTDNTESVQAPSDGEYFVVAAVFQGASTYILEVSDSVAARHLMRSDLDIMAGEVILRFDEAQMPKTLDDGARRARALGLEHAGGAAGRAMRFRAGKARLKSLRGRGRPRADAALQARLDTLNLVKDLGRRDEVLYAEPNVRRRPLAVPDDQFFDFQWHYPLINLPQAWDVTTGSSQVLVAVIDTGVLVNHPDIAANLDANDPNGVDLISDIVTANDGNGRDNNGDDAGDRAEPDGSGSFHGTHVAGTVAAVSNNGIGVAGVCQQCRIMPVRVLGVDGGSNFDIQQGMLYAAGLASDFGSVPAQAADIINLSLGGPGGSQSDQEVVNQVRAAGVIVVAAAGNDGSAALSFPASYDGVVSVAAIGPDRNRAPYSQFNAAVDVAAPGGNAQLGSNSLVVSTQASGAPGRQDFVFTIAEQQGTSMASPHVAGVAALMKSVHPGLTPAEFDNALAGQAIVDDRGTAGRDDQYGHGIINALKAVRHAQSLAAGEPVADNPVLVASPARLDFGTAGLQRGFTLDNGGTGTLEVTDIRFQNASPAFSLEMPAGGLTTGDYTVTVDRSGLSPGLYTEVITFESSANPASVQLRLEVAQGGVSTSDDAGYQYVLLIPVQDESGTAQVEVAAQGGQYSYAFEEVAPGEYILVSGTDSDNDGFICDEGESCGIYPENSRLESFVIQSDKSNVDFVADFDISLITAAGTPAKSARGFPIRKVQP